MIKLIPVTIDEKGNVVFLKEDTKALEKMNVKDFILGAMATLGLDSKEEGPALKAFNKCQNDYTARQSSLEKENTELRATIMALKEENKEIKEESKRINDEGRLMLEKYENRSEVERLDNKLTIKKYIKGNLAHTQNYTVLENGEIFKECGMRQLTENIGTKEGKEKFYQAMYKTGFKFNVVLQYLYNTQHWIAKAYVMEFLPVQKDETPDLSMFREQLLRLIALHEQYYQSVARKNYKFMDE